MGIIRKTLYAAVTIVEDAITRWGDKYNHEQELHESLRVRAGELALQNARLSDDLDRCIEEIDATNRLNTQLENKILEFIRNPVLCRDEVQALQVAHSIMDRDELAAYYKTNRSVLRALIQRCVVSGKTLQELRNAELQPTVEDLLSEWEASDDTNMTGAWMSSDECVP